MKKVTSKKSTGKAVKHLQKKRVLPMFGVVVPAYNAEATIVRTLECVKAQTYDRFRLFICDDGSLDATRSIIDTAAPKTAFRLYHAYNIGVCKTRNELLQAIMKERISHVAYCDADDFWESNHLEECAKALKTCDMVYADVKCQFLDSSPAFPFGIPYYDKFNKDALMVQNFIYISTVAHDVKCVGGKSIVGWFDDTVAGIEDWDMWRRIATAGYKIKHLKSVHAIYTVQQGGMAGRVPANAVDIVRGKQAPDPESLLRLNLGCGDQIMPGWTNIDMYSDKADVKCNVAKLPYPDNTVDEIWASHILEHSHFKEGFEVLREWYRVLKPGGKISIETPDMFNSCKLFVETSDENMRVRLYGHFFAWPWESEGQTHKFLYTEQQLSWTLSECKFRNIVRVPPTSQYVMPEYPELYLKMEAVK